MLETHRRLYNECLEWRQTAWEIYGVSLSFDDQRRWFNGRFRSNPHYSRLNNNSAHETIRKLDRAFKFFFRKSKPDQGYPRFKGKGGFASIPFGTYPNGIKLIGNRARIQHVGQVKVKLHREIRGKIKTASLKLEADKWYVVFFCDLGDIDVEPSNNPPVGIDMGIESFATTSEGEHIANPRHLHRRLPELRRQQRSLARKQRRGSNRNKARKRIARLYAHIGNLRRDHHHKVALDLVRRFGTIAVESLNIRGMLKNGRLSRAIGDAAWGGFVDILKCKAESAGVQVVEVNPRGTSQLCSGCGAEVRKDLKVRQHECPKCGLSLHRDVNAARNILARAGLARIGPAGLNSPARADAPRSSPAACAPGEQITAALVPATNIPKSKGERNVKDGQTV